MARQRIKTLSLSPNSIGFLNFLTKMYSRNPNPKAKEVFNTLARKMPKFLCVRLCFWVVHGGDNPGGHALVLIQRLLSVDDGEHFWSHCDAETLLRLKRVLMWSLSNVRDVKVSDYVLEIICEVAHHIVESGSDSWPELQDFLTQFVKGELEMDFSRDLILLKLLGDLVGELPPETIPRNLRGCLLDTLIKFTSKMDFYDESAQQTSTSAAMTSIIVLAFLPDYGDLTPKALRLFHVIQTTMLDLFKFDKDLCLKLMEDMRVYFEMLQVMGLLPQELIELQRTVYEIELAEDVDEIELAEEEISHELAQDQLIEVVTAHVKDVDKFELAKEEILESELDSKEGTSYNHDERRCKSHEEFLKDLEELSESELDGE